jgi:YHS domain-containing protein
MKNLCLYLSLLCLFPLFSVGAKEINSTFFGKLSLKGYDPVSYFTQSKPMKGKKDFEVEWKGATWRFSTEEHRSAFEKSPETYAPQYGGYCAWAVSQGDTAPIDPKQWTIEKGKLYLNYNAEIQKKWLQDKAAFIRMADENWPDLKN